MGITYKKKEGKERKRDDEKEQIREREILGYSHFYLIKMDSLTTTLTSPS